MSSSSAKTRVIRRFLARAGDSVKLRAALHDAWIGLNNLTMFLDPKRMTDAKYDELVTKIETSIRDITSSTFGLHLPEVKAEITAPSNSVLSSLKSAMSLAKAHKDADTVRLEIYRAAGYLELAIETLANNPDNDELKQTLANLLYTLIPTGNTEERWYESAIRISEQLEVKGKKGKEQAFFQELTQGLKQALEGYLELRRAAAFSYKMLPKAK